MCLFVLSLCFLFDCLRCCISCCVIMCCLGVCVRVCYVLMRCVFVCDCRVVRLCFCMCVCLCIVCVCLSVFVFGSVLNLSECKIV